MNRPSIDELRCLRHLSNLRRTIADRPPYRSDDVQRLLIARFHNTRAHLRRHRFYREAKCPPFSRVLGYDFVIDAPVT